MVMDYIVASLEAILGLAVSVFLSAVFAVSAGFCFALLWCVTKAGYDYAVSFIHYLT